MTTPAPPVQTNSNSGVSVKDEILFEGSPTPCGSCSEWCCRTRYLITSSYIEREKGLCCSNIENLQFIRVKDIIYSGCCTCSTIVVFSSDATTPRLEIKGLPNAKEMYRKIRDAVDRIQSKSKLELQVAS